MIMITAAAAAVLLTGCGGDDSEAMDICRAELESRLGEDGVVKVDDVEERTSGVLTKVEGSLVYREDEGAGDRHDTFFTCQLEGDADDLVLRELTVNE